MKKISRLLSAVLAAFSLTACAIDPPRVVRSDGTTAAVTATDNKVSTGSGKGSGTKATPDDLTATGASTSGTKADPVTQTELTTTTEVTQPHETTQAQSTATQTNAISTQPEATQPEATQPVETKPVETKPDGSTTAGSEWDIKSNLSPEFQQILDQPDNGILIIYQPSLYPEIKPITKWDITDYNTNTQILLVAKDKGSRIEITRSQLVDDDRVVIPGDIIRDWDTTSDFEVIRIVYTDPETIPFNFIRVREPNGRVTTTPIHTSMQGDVDFEVIPYDAEEP